MANDLPIDAIGNEVPDKTPKSIKQVATKKRQLKLKRGITLDCAAHHSVMPRRMAKQGAIRPSKGSLRGLHYVAANDGRIRNEGETDFEFTTGDGHDEQWTFQIAEVNKALAAVADRVDAGFKVVFDKDMITGVDTSHMVHKETGKIIKSNRKGNVWTIDAYVSPSHIGQGFCRRE